MSLYLKALRICKSKSNIKVCYRSLLSASYACEVEWNKRLNSDILKKISADSFFTELSQRYAKKLKVSAVDVDLFVNACSRVEQLEEVQNLLYKLRRTKETVNTFESTHHAVCRLFVAHKQEQRLLNILLNRVGYGIFPDHFCYNIILDAFIEDADYLSAAKVASLMMFQEDYGNNISHILALYSMHMYLRDEERAKWYDDDSDRSESTPINSNEVIDEDEEDVTYIRVPYLRNKYFDDHFDLRDPSSICGKTLYYFAKQFDDIVGRSYQIIGLALYHKWRKANELLDTFSSLNQQNIILIETIKRVESIAEKLTDDPNKDEAIELIKKLNQLNKDGKAIEGDLHKLVSDKLLNINQFEKFDIEKMPKLYNEWDHERERALSEQIKNLLSEEKRKEMIERKKQISEKERLLFFFENFSKHEIDFVEAEKKIIELKSRTKIDEDYVPPEI